jgi:hypothetical protein
MRELRGGLVRCINEGMVSPESAGIPGAAGTAISV